MVLPTLGPEISTSPSPLYSPHSSPYNTPVSSIPALSLDQQRHFQNPSTAPVKGSCDIELQPAVIEGLRHSPVRLHAKRYKTLTFAEQVVDIILSLRIPTWVPPSGSESHLSPDKVQISRVSGSLTNAVFFVSYPSFPRRKILLLRIYGPSSSTLISRSHELHTLHILSSRYGIGPRVYGTFDNGRFEEYFRSSALTAAQMRDPTISRWIASRMAELHSVDIDIIEKDRSNGFAVHRNVLQWLQPAREVLSLSSVPDAFKSDIDFDRFSREWTEYLAWVAEWENKHGASRRVFAHNDAQYGNLLRLDSVKEGRPEHHQIIVVDFEYAGPNSAAFDIANHFHEWTADYHGPTPHYLDPARYPNEEQRSNFCRSYLVHSRRPVSGESCLPKLSSTNHAEVLDMEAETCRLEAQIRVWSPASHAMWAVWGIVQAREDLELAAQARTIYGETEESEFNYLAYALCRIEGFRREIRALGLKVSA